MNNPYRDIVVDQQTKYRRIIKEAAEADATWHRDEANRRVTVISGEGWKLQFDDELPTVLTPGTTFDVLAQEWHRVIPGDSDLVLLIKEESIPEDAVDIDGVLADDPTFMSDEDEAGVDELELGVDQLEEIRAMVRQALYENTSDHEPGYKAPQGSKRDQQLDRAKAAYKRGDIETSIRIRDEMEKQAREKPGFKHRKSKYTDESAQPADYPPVMSENDDLDEGINEKTRKALKAKAEKYNAPLGALTTVYRKGLGAFYSSGSRPGMSAHGWAMARVNSFLKGGKARKVDAAQWKQVQKHRKEE